MTRKAILIIALLIQTLLPHLPVEAVAAAEQENEVDFLRSWSIPDPLWTFNTPQSLSEFSGALTFTITPDFCAGAYVGAGWPFQFTGQYPDPIQPSPNVEHDPLKMSVGNQITPTSQSLGGCESSSNPNLIFDAFAGLRTLVTIDFEVGLPHVPDPPDCTCDGWPWHWPCCAFKAVWKAAQAVFNGFMDVVGKALSSLGVDLPITIHHTWNLADFLGGSTFMEVTWAAANSPLEQTIGPLTGSIGPFPLNILPPIISDPGVVTIGLGANVVVNAWAGRITGTPHVDDGGTGMVASNSEGDSNTLVAWAQNLGNFMDIFTLRHQGIPPGNKPLPVTVTVGNLQQDMSVDVSIQPTLTIHIIAWDISLGLPLEIPLGGISDYLPGNSDLVYQTGVGLATADLSIESVDMVRDQPSNFELSLNVAVRNKGTLPAGADGYKSFAMYEGANLLTRICGPSYLYLKTGPCGGSPLESNKIYSTQIPVPLDKLSSPLRGYHSLRIVVNPDHIGDESTYENNEKQYELKVLPDLVPTQVMVNPTAPKVGDTVTISIVEWNIGVVGAPAEGYRSFAVYDSVCAGNVCSVATLAKSIYQPSQGSQPDLAPGKDWLGNVWTGKFSQPGDHKITVTVDPEDAVEEYDETNNSITTTVNVSIAVTTQTIVTVTQPPPPPKFDFSVNARPSSQSVVAGASTTYSVVVTLASGTAQPVTLSVTGLPSGALYSFSVSKATPGPYFTSTLTVTTNSRTPSGTYTLTVIATGGGATHYVRVQLIVAQPPPR